MNEAEAKSPAPAKTARKRKKDRSFWKELPVLIVVALFLTLVIKTYAIQAFYIPSGSMQNTLAIGDRVLVDKLSFEFGNVHRGDIVVFSGDGTWDPGVTPASTNFLSRFGAERGLHVRLRQGPERLHQARHRPARRQGGLL